MIVTVNVKSLNFKTPEESVKLYERFSLTFSGSGTLNIKNGAEKRVSCPHSV